MSKCTETERIPPSTTTTGRGKRKKATSRETRRHDTTDRTTYSFLKHRNHSLPSTVLKEQQTPGRIMTARTKVCTHVLWGCNLWSLYGINATSSLTWSVRKQITAHLTSALLLLLIWADCLHDTSGWKRLVISADNVNKSTHLCYWITSVHPRTLHLYLCSRVNVPCYRYGC